jgi:hypothetical protein
MMSGAIVAAGPGRARYERSTESSLIVLANGQSDAVCQSVGGGRADEWAF